MARIKDRQRRSLNRINRAAFDAKLGDAIDSYRKLALFALEGAGPNIQTGTGGAQTFPHGIVDEAGNGVKPNLVLVVPQDNNVTAITYGTIDKTNVTVTVTNNAKYALIVAFVPTT